MLGQVTKYGTLPPIPGVSALPGGVPVGPWQSLAHLTPGAVVPSPSYPALQMQGSSGLGQEVKFEGFGRRAPVTFQGLGQTTDDKGPAKKIAMLAVTTAVAGGFGALFAAATRSRRPTLYPGLVLGGYTLISGRYYWAMNGKKA